MRGRAEIHDCVRRRRPEPAQRRRCACRDPHPLSAARSRRSVALADRVRLRPRLTTVVACTRTRHGCGTPTPRWRLVRSDACGTARADHTWVICGQGRLAGSYEGPDAIFGLWKRIARTSRRRIAIEVQDVLANDRRGVVLVVDAASEAESRLDERQVAVFVFADDSTVERATFIYEDPAAYDSFWSD